MRFQVARLLSLEFLAFLRASAPLRVTMLSFGEPVSDAEHGVPDCHGEHSIVG